VLVNGHWCIALKDPKVVGYREVEVVGVGGVGWLLVVLKCMLHVYLVVGTVDG